MCDLADVINSKEEAKLSCEDISCMEFKYVGKIICMDIVHKCETEGIPTCILNQELRRTTTIKLEI